MLEVAKPWDGRDMSKSSYDWHRCCHMRRIV